MTSSPTPSRRTQPIVYFIGFTAALAGLLFGLDVGVISGAEGFIKKDFDLTDRLIEFIVSSLLWGAAVGALGSGILSSHLGRRKTILISAVIFIIGSLLCAYAPNEHVLIGARFLLGLAVGVASFTAPLYLSEISPQIVRGSMISMYQLMITIGIVLAFLSNTWLATYATFDGVTGGHWRVMLGVIAIPAAVMFAGVYFLPESPRWLFLKGFQEKAKDVFRKMKLDEAEIAAEVQEIEDSVKVKQNGFQLFMQNGNFRRAIALGVGLQIIQQLTGINVIMYYAPRIFGMAGFESTNEQMWGTVIVGVTNVLATFIAIAFVDRLGRKPIMYAGFVTMGVALLTVGGLFAIGGQSHTAPNAAGVMETVTVLTNPDLAYPAIFALLVFIVGFAMSAGPIIWVLCSEIYPLAGRDLGVTFSTGTNWIVNAIVGMTFLTLINNFGPGNTFLLYGGMNVLFIIFFLFFVPETKGVSLEKIERNLLSGLPLRKIGR
ncbi:MFS transporter, SP family [Terrimicrobium sacchariphilum]|uniref:MFS transporter, SP family n=1 Tax=Terrimicrobium sacchariphilum TaxID=690879 RepID=A0A146G8L3_TERSA|nr:sugar porter family MFS transporter [Terrimicrobium sacchariphilum]GAT33234.1 MFS transporter, SP family [Terrimicrobium sacchariphilum]